jgi:hypothetical protein
MFDHEDVCLLNPAVISQAKKVAEAKAAAEKAAADATGKEEQQQREHIEAKAAEEKAAADAAAAVALRVASEAERIQSLTLSNEKERAGLEFEVRGGTFIVSS